MIGCVAFMVGMWAGAAGSWRVIVGKAGKLEVHSQNGGEILHRIRETLMRELNAGRVENGFGAAEKYDSYAVDVYCILTRSRSEEALVEYLYGPERRKMGLPGSSRNRLREVAGKLLSLEVKI
jgi:hypothetical protein